MNSNLQLWEIVYHWLRNTNKTLNKNYCRKELTIHPDYPSLISLIDFLDAGQIAYRAVRADSSYIEEFEYPLLAHVNKPGEEYLHIVNKADEWSKAQDLSIYWTGNVIYLERNIPWQNSINISYVNNEIKSRLIIGGLITFGLTLLVKSFFQISLLPLQVYGFLSLVGLITAIYIMGAELGFQNEITKEVCGAFNSSGCKQVIGSKYAKSIWGITPGDLSVAYFFCQFFLYIAGMWNSDLFTSLPIFSLLALPAVGWSIYIQAIKIKKWCGLCLILGLILLVQGILSTSILFDFNNVFPVVIFSILFILVISVLFPVKRMINNNIVFKKMKAEFNNWKLDGSLFVNQWKEELQADTRVWQDDLILGDPLTPLRISIACSTTCVPCANAHAHLELLLNKFKTKLHLQIRFLNNPENHTDMRTKGVKAILQRSMYVQNNEELQALISDWFKWMDYEKWAAKWLTPQVNSAQEAYVQEKLIQHFEWIEQNNIRATPTFFINGRMLPARYQLKDVELLIPQLSELMYEIHAKDGSFA